MHLGKVGTLASYTLWRESRLLILCNGFSRHLIQKISKRLSRFRIHTPSGRAGNLKTYIDMTYSRGYATLRFSPSEEGVIEVLNRSGKCYIHFHTVGGKVDTEALENTNSAITGPGLYNNIRSNPFIKAHRNRIEKIVVSVHENPEA